VREVFLEVDAPTELSPGQRVWAEISRTAAPRAAR
jgi:hypothetical protein